jgi:hypothetical protein
MTTVAQLSELLRQVRQVAELHPFEGLVDADLFDRFRKQGDVEAFAANC